METGQRVIITGAPKPEALQNLLRVILAWKLAQSDTDKPSVTKKDGG